MSLFAYANGGPPVRETQSESILWRYDPVPALVDVAVKFGLRVFDQGASLIEAVDVIDIHALKLEEHTAGAIYEIDRGGPRLFFSVGPPLDQLRHTFTKRICQVITFRLKHGAAVSINVSEIGLPACIAEFFDLFQGHRRKALGKIARRPDSWRHQVLRLDGPLSAFVQIAALAVVRKVTEVVSDAGCKTDPGQPFAERRALLQAAFDGWLDQVAPCLIDKAARRERYIVAIGLSVNVIVIHHGRDAIRE